MTISKYLAITRDAALGPARSRAARALARARAGRRMEAVLGAIEASGFVPPDDGSDPVFVLAAGWRSGSTFLQRMLVAGGERLIWGEPYDCSRIVQHARRQLLPLSTQWPESRMLVDEANADELSERWIANLYPPIPDLWAAHRALLDRLFGAPAVQRGYARWGMKEVRLDADDACYLQWLYPRARFVFLVRNPFDAWRSYRGWRNCFASWPDGLVDTPFRFGRHWSRLAGDFLHAPQRLRAKLVRYEDLHDARTLDEIAAFIEQPLPDPASLSRLDGDAGPVDWVPKVERWLLAAAVRATAAPMGYTGVSPRD